MGLKAGFAETDITPPVGTPLIGWLRAVPSRSALDPLFARAAVFASEERRVAFLQLDVLSIRWKQVSEIRRRISDAYGFPGENVMVAATHNHAGPAVVNCGEVPRDDAYLREMTDRVVRMFGQALSGLREAEVGVGSTAEFRLSFNRRVRFRDGTVRTQATFDDPDALCLEGPVDPEVAVLAARAPGGGLLGAIVNFACHPTHHGSDGRISAGFPGALAREMRARGCPITLFLNGAAGNLIFFDARRGNTGPSMEEMGAILAEDAFRVIDALAYRGAARLDCRARTVALPFRALTEEEIQGRVRGAQRFVDPALYDREIPALVERIRARGRQSAQVQVISLDEHAYAAIPAEYFVELGLKIKEAAYPRRAQIVGFANGMVGYVPHRQAFARGGYETTFGGGSHLAPEAGEILADAAVAQIREGARP